MGGKEGSAVGIPAAQGEVGIVSYPEAPDQTGKAPKHKEVAERAKASEANNKPMVKSNDKNYGKDYRIDIKGILIIPSLHTPKPFFITEQAKWDEKISPTVPENYQPRYHKSMLLTEESPEYKNNIEEFKWWKPLKDKVAGLLKSHQSDIPKGTIPKIYFRLMKSGYNTDESLSPEYNRIIGVGIYFGRGIYNTYIVTESFARSKRFNRTLKDYSISEMGSSFVNKMLNRYPNKVFIEAFYNTISQLIQTYQVFLLGREGLQAYYETADDRRLVEALAHGAIMDEEGYISDPITGDRF